MINLASHGPRTAVHSTGSAEIYTRLSRLAGRTVTQQHVNTFILSDGVGLASTAATHSATTSSLELVAAPASGSARHRPRPRRVSFGSLVAIDAHRSRRIVPTSAGGTSESPWLITIIGPLVVVREATGNQVTRSSPRVAWRRVIVEALCGVLVAKCVSLHFAQLFLGCGPAGAARGLRDTSRDGSRRVIVSAVLLRRTTASVRMRAIAAAAAAARTAEPDAASAPKRTAARWLRAQQ